MANRNGRLVGLLLLVSGACSLIFQTVWFREFRLVFGASTLASSAVLAIFMGGLGLGNAVLGRLADRTAKPLQLYAKLEFLISLLCAISPLLIVAVRAVYIAIGGQETLGAWGATLFRLIGAVLVIGVPTFLMGGTLPAAARAATTDDDTNRKTIGYLYGLNTVGAVIGVVVSTFFLLELVGTRGTLWIACVLNLLNSMIAWQVGRNSSPVVVESTATEPTGLTGQLLREPVVYSVPPMLIYAAAAIMGCAFFLMELVWYRMLAPILGGSTFTFGLILAVALSGIGIGGACYPLLFRRRQPTLYSFILTLALEAIAIGIPILLGDQLAILALALRDLAVFGFAGSVLGWSTIALVVVFPAAILSGVQFPVLIALLGQADKHVGKELGQAFGWNTIGSMVGALAGGFGLLTLLSATGVWKLVIVGLVLFAVILLIYAWPRTDLKSSILLVALLLLGGGSALQLGPTEVWRHGSIGAGRAKELTTRNQLIDWSNGVRRKIIWQTDGRESTVAIDTKASLNFLVNGKSDGNAVGDAGTQIMLGVLPAVLHPNATSGLVIGLGTGESAGWLASLDSIEKVDIVELEPAVTKMAESCAAFNHDVLNHPKVTLTFNDARELLQTTQKRYDIIASEPSNPYRSGVSSLYTTEFYQAASLRLNPGGLFSQWLQGYEVNSTTVGTVLKTLKSVFPHVEMWQTQGGDMVLLCSLTPFEYSLESISNQLATPNTARATQTAWKTAAPDSLLSHLIAAELYVDKVTKQEFLTVNTDDRNSLEYAFARTVGRSGGFQIEQIRSQATDLGLRWPARLSQTIESQRINDHAIGAAVFTSRSVDFVGDQLSPRENVWRAIQEDRTSDAIRLWDEINEPPRDFTEMLLIGLVFANGLDRRLPELLQEIALVSPADADALACIVAIQGNDPQRATLALGQFFQRMLKTPVVSEPLFNRCLLIAKVVAKQQPQFAAEMYAALSQPFCLHYADQMRIDALIEIADLLGPREVVDAMLPLEPYPIWTQSMLFLRRDAYRQLNLPLAPQAIADVQLYFSQADRPLLNVAAK